jgi:hypothetical protein
MFKMPRGNGTGPPWRIGLGAGRGARQSQSQRGRTDGSAAGEIPEGECMCQNCGATVPHELGIPCYFTKCPKCGSKMVRK